jgi:hypothetical protein
MNKKFWTELIDYFVLIWTAEKTIPRTILCCRGNVFTGLLPSNDKCYTDRPTETRVHQCSIVMCIHCSRNVFADLLPSNEKRDTLYRAFA